MQNRNDAPETASKTQAGAIAPEMKQWTAPEVTALSIDRETASGGASSCDNASASLSS